jgi:hypothetical protein
MRSCVRFSTSSAITCAAFFSTAPADGASWILAVRKSTACANEAALKTKSAIRPVTPRLNAVAELRGLP